MTIKDKILEKLIKNKGKSISGEQLASELSVSRTAIWKHIKVLKDEGYMINSSTNIGYSLNETPDMLTSGEIKAGLRTKVIGKDIKYFKETESTNIIAREIASSVDEGTVVIAESQTSGRGRLGRKWISPEGGIWLSLIHISEPTRLRRISYAVFCLKKKKKINNTLDKDRTSDAVTNSNCHK